ncbi:MAG: type II toxin-antitoxin system HicA family toxin [Oscillospiraceae bacterium]|nr:type II toxin-antitoxin system HicA family toxin [Oscillospiraceae bacterium]
MAEFEKKVRELLGKSGFAFIRHGKGSHDIWMNHSSKISVSVPSKIKSRHTANEILKDAKINSRF